MNLVVILHQHKRRVCRVNHNRGVRDKSDMAWEFISVRNDSDGKKIFICCFCRNEFKGGGINRMKMHLAGQSGNIRACLKVPKDVRFNVKQSLNEFAQRKQDHQRKLDEMDPFSHCDIGVDAPSSSQAKKRKQGASSSSSGIASYFHKVSDKAGLQPSIKAAFQTKERKRQVDLAVARVFYEACIPLIAVNSPYFQQMINAVSLFGEYQAPSYYDLRTNLLVESKKELQLLVDTYRVSWEEYDCTIMGDGWKDKRQRCLINFLVYSPNGITFLKSVDASDIVSTAANLCDMFSEVVEYVGSKNVVQMVTDNAANYKAAGRLLNEKYPHIF